MKLITAPHPDDLAAVRLWFDRLSAFCRAIDYEGAREIFAEDMIAFGTFTDFMKTRDLAEQKQWLLDADKRRRLVEIASQPPQGPTVTSGTEARAVFRSVNRAEDQRAGEKRIDRVIDARLHDAHRSGREQQLEHRGADHDLGRHLQEINHHRHHDESAAYAHQRGEHADERACCH